MTETQADQPDPAAIMDEPTKAADVQAAVHWWHETYGAPFSPHHALLETRRLAAALAETERALDYSNEARVALADELNRRMSLAATPLLAEARREAWDEGYKAVDFSPNPYADQAAQDQP